MRVFWSLLLIACIAALVTSPVAAAKSHRFDLTRPAAVNGVDLKPGTYKARFNGDNVLEIMKGGKVLATAKAELQPLGDDSPHSVTLKKGALVEIRLGKEKIVLIGS